MKAEFTFYSDPSHGWAQIPHRFIYDLGIAGEISNYSYQDDNCAYLEEDCDLYLFMHKAQAKGWEITFKERTFNHDCAIRNYPRYTRD